MTITGFGAGVIALSPRPPHIARMCGRITQKRGELPGFVTVLGDDRDNRIKNTEAPPRYNGAPSQDFWVLRRHPQTGAHQRDRMVWGFREPWMAARNMKPQINARGEDLAGKRMFANAYARRRCLVPVDNFFEWRSSGPPPRVPYAVAMANGQPFALAGLWTAHQDAATGLWTRSFAVVTTAANEMIADIHDRMPVIIAPNDYDRWLGPEPDPHDLIRPYPAELMAMWRISPRVNSPKNDDAGILEGV
jgi:putative SOS response-associated peptidase YedK